MSPLTSPELVNLSDVTANCLKYFRAVDERAVSKLRLDHGEQRRAAIKPAKILAALWQTNDLSANGLKTLEALLADLSDRRVERRQVVSRPLVTRPYPNPRR